MHDTKKMTGSMNFLVFFRENYICFSRKKIMLAKSFFPREQMIEGYHKSYLRVEY